MSQGSLISHFTELRTRAIYSIITLAVATGLCFVFVENIYEFLVEPLRRTMGANDTNRLIYTGLTEAFFTYMKVAFFTGLFVSLPVLLMQIWMFIAPGLYKNEKGAILPFMVATPLLFLAGGAFVYYVVIPPAWDFFLSFQTPGQSDHLAIQLEARVSEYLDLIITLIFAFGLCFQIPVLLVLLGRSGMIKRETLKKFRKFALVFALVLAAFLTPPDPLSQILLAVPILLLYEISIWLIPKTK